LDNSFCSDDTILSCIKLEENSLQKLVSNKQVFHHLITLGRLRAAIGIKEKLSEEVLRVKDETGRNILHTLVDYLATNGAYGSRLVMDIFNFVCLRFPEMLAEPDNQGHTVYDDIERLKPHCDNTISEEIESTLMKCHVGTIKMSLGYS
jgi:hypothetical protein